MKKGDLYQSLWPSTYVVLAEVVRTWNHRDIDPDCPESVAIVGMVEVIMLTGPDLSKKQKYRTSQFNRIFKQVQEAQ